MKRTCELNLELQQPIRGLPIPPQQLQNVAASNDDATIEFWREIWLRNMKANKEKFGSFHENGLHKLYKAHLHKPAICIGSGPSLKHYAKHLVPGAEIEALTSEGLMTVKAKGNPGILVLSALHNFAYLTDLGVKVDYWVSLDAGEVVIDEMADGGTKDMAFYREASKGQKLLCYVATNPRLFDNWQGEVMWFNSIMPNEGMKKLMNEIEPYRCTVSSGGNVLGACMYIAKAIMGCNPIIYMGADFSFSYDSKFHSFNSKYDKQGAVVKTVDIYGNKVSSWPSYLGFKSWFDAKHSSVPGLYINCSDGCMGAYDQGNVIDTIQMNIEMALEMYRVSDHLKDVMENPSVNGNDLVLF